MPRSSSDPASLAPAALAELKQHLGITLADEDAALVSELRAALAIGEAFVGQPLLRRPHRDVHRVSSGWIVLLASPVSAITGVTGMDAAGTRFALLPESYALDIDTDGHGRVRLVQPGTASRVEIAYAAGLADDWTDLAEPLRLGVIRMAAHGYRARGQDALGDPPAAIAALWRPWRRMRLK